MFKAEDIGDGTISVSHSNDKYILVSRSQARRMGLGVGGWEMVPAGPEERGCWLMRTKGGGNVLVTMRAPDCGRDTGLVRSFCWDIFARTTGLDLEPGKFGKYKLVAYA
jgi:hypothetical protein